MNDHEKELLRLHFINTLQCDADLFDFESEIDSSLTYQENKNILTDKMQLLKKDRFILSRPVIKEKEWIDIPLKKTKDSLLKQAFADKRIIALAGEKNTGKTNNIIFMVRQFREENPDVPIFSYGLPPSVQRYLSKFDVWEISSMNHLIKKKNCLIILDEFQKMKLNDRRFKDLQDEFVDFVYHNNVWVLLSSPNLREFNSVIGSFIERWMLKDVKLSSCINGSQLKRAIDSYKGSYRTLSSVSVPKDEILVLNDDIELVLRCGYVKEADSKNTNKSIF